MHHYQQEKLLLRLLCCSNKKCNNCLCFNFIFYFIIDFEIKNYFTLIAFTFLSSFILGALGIIAGLWAEKFDHMATVTNFIIVPLSFLSGTFYTIDKLPGYLYSISKANPFFYMIDGFRYSFLEKSDGSIM